MSALTEKYLVAASTPAMACTALILSLIHILVLSAKDGEYDKVLGLNLGADDYIAKPFGMMELIARVKALLRRVSEQTESPYYETDILYVHPARHVVKVAGEEIALTLKEFEMLCLLLQNKGIVMTRDNILSKV